MSKKKIIIIVGSVAVFGMLVFAGYKLYVGVSAFSQAEKNLQASLAHLSTYYAGNPFPSQENIEMEMANLKTLDDWFATLVEGIRKGQVHESHERRPSKFIDTWTGKRNEIRALAKGTRPAVLLADDFAVGFKRYSFGDLPDPKYVPRLTQQLVVMDSVCRIMIDSGVSEISMIHRESVEDKVKFKSPKSFGKKLAHGGAKIKPSVFISELKRQKPNPDAGVLAKDQLYTKFHFKYLIRVDEESLVVLLNRIAESPMFAVVTKVSVQKEKNDIVLPEKKESKREGGTQAESVLSGEALLANMLKKADGVTEEDAPDEEAEDADNDFTASSVPLSRMQKIVSGPPFEKLLDVLIEFDVYRFGKVEVKK